MKTTQMACRAAPAAVLLGFIFTARSACAEITRYVAGINANWQVPPTASPALGEGLFTLDDAKVLSYTIWVHDLLGSEIVSHLHAGRAPGSAVFSLPLGGIKSGSVGPLTPDLEAGLANEHWYVEIHTTSFPDGEVSGVILHGVAVDSKTWSGIKGLFR